MLLIWLPSEYGIRSGSAPFSQKIRDRGVDVWLVDLHQSYMVPTGRKSYGNFEYQDIYELISYAQKQGRKKIFIGGASRAAILALSAARHWQINNPETQEVKGLVLFHPHLVDGFTEIGDKARYLNIAKETNLPVYILQPQYSTKYFRSNELIEQLEVGGAQVFFHPVMGVNGGYHVRPDGDLTDLGIKEKSKVGERVVRALQVLEFVSYPPAEAPEFVRSVPEKRKARGTMLKPMAASQPPESTLQDQNGDLFDPKELRSQVVLINFWATWCKPCVEEIPSLIRLKEKMKGKPFKLLTVNIGESKEHVGKFFGKIEIQPNFEVLFDPEGVAAKNWNIYAYPSSYLLGKKYKIRYAYSGALQWDNVDTVTTVTSLIDE